MHIPKIINKLPKQISFLTRKIIFGDDLNEYKTDNDLLMEKTEKVLEIARKLLKDYDLTIPDDEKESSIKPVENNFTPTVNNELYLKPKKMKISEWLNILKAAKYSSGLEGIPYRWIDNRGKIKIHNKAIERIEREKLREEQAHCLVVKMQLSTLPSPPSTLPSK